MNPTVEIKQTNVSKSSHIVSPNFIMINRPGLGDKSKKSKLTKRLIVWFDVKNQSDIQFKSNSLPAQIKLTNFEWQLTMINGEGNFEKLTPTNEKEDIVKKGEYIIYRDTEGQIIKPENCLMYDLEDFGEELTLHYNVQYENNDHIGITETQQQGKNKGTIKIGSVESDDNFANAFIYNENSNEKLTLVNNDRLIVSKKQVINSLSAVNEPVLSVKTVNEQKTTLEIDKSEQLKAELDVIRPNRISYLQTEDKSLKIAQNGDNYDIYKSSGNHYDFQTDKWVESKEDKLVHFNEKELNLKFKFNNHEFKNTIKINSPISDIRQSNNSKENLKAYIKYQNVKPNTKFDTFVKAGEDLWK